MARRLSSSTFSTLGERKTTHGWLARRLALGTVIVLLIAYGGLSTKFLFPIDTVWPVAGLIAALGWGRGLLSARAILLLLAFGVLQDIQSTAPFGSWSVVFLSVYGLVAALSGMASRLPLAGATLLTTLAGSLFAWLIVIWITSAVGTGGNADGRLVLSIGLSGLAFLLLQPVFNIGRTREDQS